MPRLNDEHTGGDVISRFRCAASYAIHQYSPVDADTESGTSERGNIIYCNILLQKPANNGGGGGRAQKKTGRSSGDWGPFLRVLKS